MSDVKYSFGIDQFKNNKVDISKLDLEIRSSPIVISLAFLASSDYECDCWFKDYLSQGDLTTLSGLISEHDGVDDSVDDYIYHIQIMDEYRDRSGKLRVHQTSRKLGTMILWTGEGDNPDIPDSVGGGEKLAISYTAGSEEPLVRYIDLNCTDNETWIHEGYITWGSALLDSIDLKIVPRVTPTVSGVGTNFAIYDNYLIVPTYPGTGTVEIASDITTSTGGLVYMPLNDLGVRTPAFWDATWNPITKRFEDIQVVPYGNGKYNMFSTEISLSHIVRSMNLIGNGFIPLNSSDVDEIGNGMRLKFTTDVNKSVRDHDLLVACTLCLHRKKSVNNDAFI